jgi:hypothetical protein
MRIEVAWLEELGGRGWTGGMGRMGDMEAMEAEWLS